MSFRSSLTISAVGSLLLLPEAGAVESAVKCPGEFDVKGYGKVQLIPTGWADDDGFEPVDVSSKGELVAHMDARAYFADECTAGKYDHKQYMAYNLLGKTMRYTLDLTGAGCGCNAALYLTSMAQNTQPSECSDFYCDANNVCGESCAEIDIQEANQFAWHSTLHTATDHSGVGGGFGGGDSWDGPRDWGSAEYGKGAKCIDTTKPFQVAFSFPVDSGGALAAMEVTLTQTGKDCPLSVRLGSYDGMAELSEALKAGMTPIVSYWSANDMLWMDGTGMDGQGPCAVDDKDACGETVKFYDFSITDIGDSPPAAGSSVKASSGNTPPPGVTAASGYDNNAPSSTKAPVSSDSAGSAFATAATAIVASSHSSSTDSGSCSKTQKFDCRDTKCCSEPGMQCYQKHDYWAACKETCVPGSMDPEDEPEFAAPWSCKKLGPRTPGAKRSSTLHSSSSDSANTDSHVNGTAEGKVILRVRASASLPELMDGKEVTLSLGGHALTATVLEEGESGELSLADALLERFDTSAAGESVSTAEPSALRFAGSAVALACVAVFASVAVARRRLASSAGAAQLLPVEPSSPLEA